MGLCSSVHRNEQTNMKHHLTLSFESKTESLLIPSSPFEDKEKPKNGNFVVVADDDAFKPQQWSPSRSTTTFSVKDCGDNEPISANMLCLPLQFHDAFLLHMLVMTTMDFSPGYAVYGIFLPLFGLCGDGKEESFFDSKAWLDSDCDDDFYSVKGEFTPSRGSTPVHHIFLNKTTPSEPCSVPEPSPTTQKKKLLDLFRESVRENQSDDAENTFGNEKKEVKPTMVHDLIPKSAHSTPYVSGGNSACSSERTMNDDHAPIREKPVKSVQCCLPSLASCRSFSERKRKTSPAIAANGTA
ncbi:Hypothetical protein glysoja_027427 [Glycine soja]|uniref:Uncharacterized protein n=1 Tax=Glycine soja TaxID=3848 RepID=A0A0B2PT42_GLYSO|nr:Hypothetical protein glysoja_027427 [Glycine soja]